MPEVTVLMSVYNGEKYLRQCIDTVLSQTYGDFEFLIIDDGSNDSTYPIITSYSDPRIKVIRQSNCGLTKSLNRGLRMATGEFIARIDADDYAMPDRLEKQLYFLQHNTDIALVGSNAMLIDESGKRIGRTHFTNEHEKFVTHLEEGKSGFPHSSFFFRIEAVRQIGGYNERYIKAQDKDLLLRFCQKYRVACIPEPLIALRLSSSSFGRSDGRYLQKKYDMAALINYFRRKNGMQDLSMASKEKWESFFNEVGQWFDNRGYGRKSDAKKYFRQFRSVIRRGKIFKAARLLGLALKLDFLFFTYRDIGLNPVIALQEFIERDF